MRNSQTILALAFSLAAAFLAGAEESSEPAPQAVTRLAGALQAGTEEQRAESARALLALGDASVAPLQEILVSDVHKLASRKLALYTLERLALKSDAAVRALAATTPHIEGALAAPVYRALQNSLETRFSDDGANAARLGIELLSEPALHSTVFHVFSMHTEAVVRYAEPRVTDAAGKPDARMLLAIVSASQPAPRLKIFRRIGGCLPPWPQAESFVEGEPIECDTGTASADPPGEIRIPAASGTTHVEGEHGILIGDTHVYFFFGDARLETYRIMQYLLHNDPRVRMQAISLLRSRGAKSSVAVPALKWLAATEKDENVKKAAEITFSYLNTAPK